MCESLSPSMASWFGTSANVATTIGAAIAICAAYYSQRQARAADAALVEVRKQSALTKAQLQELRRQTEISLHPNRLAIYKSLIQFRYFFNVKASAIPKEALWAYWENVQLAEIYFAGPISTAMQTTFDQARELQMLMEDIKNPDVYDSTQLPGQRSRRELLQTQIGSALETLDHDIKVALKLVSVDA
jgi:hypothetical protein